MEYTLREFRVGDLHDAELLAAMMNASDAGWPGGLTGGIPETAERIMERTQRSDRIAIFVVEVDGEIVGYGDLSPTRGRDDSAYLDFLNVCPDFHGKGLGKALVLKIVERTIESGRKQLTIGTWAGNRRSVPLYKKTGFFWVPDTSVWMQNYIPTALSMPIARQFFAKHYWYGCFKRELEMVPDDIEWNGIKVYPYRFEEGGDLFAMWIDRHSEAPTAVETNDLYVACTVGREEIVCGLEQKVKWEIVSKKGTDEPMQVALMAEGEEGVGLSVIENLEVKDRATIDKPFTVAPDIKPKDPEMPTHQIKSTLLLNGVPLTLGTAVKPVQPVDIQFSTKMVVSGKSDEKIVAKLKSNLDFPVKGELLIDPHPALHFDKLSAPFTLEPNSWTSCTFYVRVDGSGAFTTRMRAVCPPDLNPDSVISGSPLATKSKPVTFLTQPLDSVYAWYNEEEKAVTVESPTLWIRMQLRGGNMTIHERLSGRNILYHRVPQLGPPFAGWHEAPTLYEYRLEQKDGRVSLTIIVPSDRAPGLTVEKTITVGAGNFARIDHRILNNTNAARKFKLHCGAWCELMDGDSRLTLPLKEDLLHQTCEGWGGFPMRDRDLSKKPKDYAESWSAVENSGIVVGAVFGECEEREHDMTLQFDLPEIPPRSYYDLEPFYLVVGRGNWEMVRQLWRWLKQPSTVREDRNPVAHPVLKAGFEPAPLLVTQAEMNARFSVRSLRMKALNGEWRIENSELQIRPANGDIADVSRGSPFVKELSLSTSDLSPRVETAQVMISNEVTTREFTSPVVILGDADRPVAISSESSDNISVDNGYFSFTVAPAFLGSVTALERDGVNHLHTAYPEAKPYLWHNFWYGGIHPFLGWTGNQKFVREQFSGEPIERSGKRGIAWHGVKVVGDLQHKDLRWLRMEIEYLTFGGSNVLAIVHRVINRTDGPQHEGNLGIDIWPAVGDSISYNVMHYLRNQPCYEQAASTDQALRVQRHRRLGEYGFEPPSGRWVAVENQQTGHVLSLVAPHPDTRAGVESERKDTGCILWVAGGVNLEPGETKERVSWLVLTDSVEEARKYQALGEIWELL
jgi:GNAT superfamily N-acetyltransferase